MDRHGHGPNDFGVVNEGQQVILQAVQGGSASSTQQLIDNGQDKKYDMKMIICINLNECKYQVL